MRGALNIAVVFVLSGLWHGANWTFVVWGALHGAFLLLERRYLACPRLVAAFRGSWAVVLGIGITLAAVVAAWVPFRSPDMSHALHYWARMFNPWAGWSLHLAGPALVVLIMYLLAHFWTYYCEKQGFVRRSRWLCLEGLVYLGLVCLLPGPSENFIYFQF